MLTVNMYISIKRNFEYLYEHDHKYDVIIKEFNMCSKCCCRILAKKVTSTYIHFNNVEKIEVREACFSAIDNFTYVELYDLHITLLLVYTYTYTRIIKFI